MDIEKKITEDAYRNSLNYNVNKAAYREEENRLQTEFMGDLQTALSSWGVPAQYICGVVQYAWSEGHSSGYHEVYNYARNIAESIFKV